MLLENGCVEKVDMYGYKSIRYPNHTLEKYDPNNKLMSRIDGQMRIQFIFNKPTRGKVRIVDMDTGQKTVVDINSKVERKGYKIFETLKNNDRFILNNDGSKSVIKKNW